MRRVVFNKEVFREMEEPVNCPKCGEWVELFDCRRSDLSRYLGRKTNELICDSCADEENEVYEMIEEIDDIQLDLDSNAEHTRGNRRECKSMIKDLKGKIRALGYNYDDLKF